MTLLTTIPMRAMRAKTACADTQTDVGSVEAVIIFEEHNTHWLSWLLHPHFRHVWHATRDPRTGHWMGVNLTLSSGIQVGALAPADFDLAAHYRAQGLEVVEITARPCRRGVFPLMLNNCVGITKACLGVRSWAVTPHQLRRHLERHYL